MESEFARGGVRLSNSPRRSPIVAQNIYSPTTSVAGTVLPGANMAESLHDQPDPGLRTTDFFDDNDDDDDSSDNGFITASNNADKPSLDEAIINPLPSTAVEQSDSLSDQRFAFVTSAPHEAIYGRENNAERLSPSRSIPNQPNRTSKISSSFNGSIREMLPPNEQDEHIRFQDSPVQAPPKAHIPQSPTAEASLESSQPTDRQCKVEHQLGAHAFAHQLALQALIRDEDTLHSLAMAPLSDAIRLSILPAPLRTHDRTSSHEIDIAPAAASTEKTKNKPSPIDTSVSHRTSEAAIRTPFPLPSRDHELPKSKSAKKNSNIVVGWKAPGQVQSPGGWQYAAITVSVRSEHHSNSNRAPRVEQLEIPESTGILDGTYDPITGQTEGEMAFRQPRYTDEELFNDIRATYTDIVGKYHRFAARKVRDVKILGRDHLSCTQERLMKHDMLDFFRNPALGRETDGVVENMHYLSEHAHHYEHDRRRALRLPVNNPDVRFPVPKDGFEIIVGWAVVRILVVASLVLACSLVATVLWICLASNAVPGHVGGFVHDAAGRVTTGVVLGISILLLGLTGMAGWMGVSWNSMR